LKKAREHSTRTAGHRACRTTDGADDRRQLAQSVQDLNVPIIHQHGRVLRQQCDGREPLAVFRQPLQYEQGVAMLLFQRLKRIGAIRQVHRRGRNIVSLQRLQILAHVLVEATLAVWFCRNVAGGVQLLAPVLTARVYVDAVAVPGRNLAGQRKGQYH